METTTNIETLKRLADEVGEETVSLLLNVFSDELEQYFQQLTDQPTIEKIGEISHAIKSSAASFGADDLSFLAQECESRVKQGQNDWVLNHLPKFKQMVELEAVKYKQLARGNEFINSVL